MLDVYEGLMKPTGLASLPGAAGGSLGHTILDKFLRVIPRPPVWTTAQLQLVVQQTAREAATAGASLIGDIQCCDAVCTVQQHRYRLLRFRLCCEGNLHVVSNVVCCCMAMGPMCSSIVRISRSTKKNTIVHFGKEF